MNNKSSFLILNISDNKIIFHAANNWGQFKLPGDYKELYLYIELINTIKTVKQTKDTKCLFAFAFNDKYLTGNFNVTVFMNADGNITTLLSKNENPSLHSQIKEMRDSFTASIGHELKTPLTSILSMIELMKLTELTPKQNDYLKFLDTSSLQLTSIINDILDFNKLETNNIQLEHKQTNLRRCIDDAVTIVAADFALIPLEYIVSIPSGIPIDV
jgi:signal transduction histidine kinase